MPTPPYAKVLVSVAGGALTSGAITVTAGQTVQLQIENSSGVTAYLWEILDYPPGFALPSGWTSNAGVYQSTAAVPPAFTVPTQAQNNWGPFVLRLRVNGNPLARNPDGSPNASYQSALTDTGTVLKFASSHGCTGVGFGESTQWDALRAWVGAVMHDVRILDAAVGGGGSVTWANDLAGSTSSNQYVAAISGSGGAGGTVTLNIDGMQFSATTSVATISQADNAATSGTPMLFRAQNAAGVNRTGGDMVFQSGAKTGTGTDGSVIFKLGAAGEVARWVGGTSTLQWAAASASPTLKQAAAASDVATQSLTVSPQAPFASAATNLTPGNVKVAIPTVVGSPAATEGRYGQTQFLTGATKVAYVDHETGDVVANSAGKAVRIGAYYTGAFPGTASPTYGAIYFAGGASAPTSTNYSIVSDGSSTVVNGTSVSIAIAGTVKFGVFGSSTQVQTAYPILGDGALSPYSVHGDVTVTPSSNADVTLTAAQYAATCITVATGSWLAGHNIVLPNPGVGFGYTKIIRNTSSFTATVSVGVGATVGIATGKTAIVWLANGNVFRVTADA